MAGTTVLPDWLRELDEAARDALSKLPSMAVPSGTTLFRPGEDPRGFVLVLRGKVGVHLLGRNGRELRLYTVEPGETCIQTTIGLLGGNSYTGEAIAESDLDVIMVPPPLFHRLMGQSPTFREFVFRAFGTRLGDVMHVLEQVAFVKIEQRLARHLLENADSNGKVNATHQDIAVAIGSVREVVSRRLDAMEANHLVKLDRGTVTITDRVTLGRMSE